MHRLSRTGKSGFKAKNGWRKKLEVGEGSGLWKLESVSIGWCKHQMGSSPAELHVPLHDAFRVGSVEPHITLVSAKGRDWLGRDDPAIDQGSVSAESLDETSTLASRA